MGNNHTTQPHPNLLSKYNPHDWSFQSKPHEYQIWRNKYTSQSVQVYHFDDINIMKHINRYQIRSYDNDLVKVYHIVMEDQRQELCKVNSSVNILMERIPLRLYHISNINREEALTIFVAALRAFSMIQQTCQIVVPNQTLIGFNQKGKTKVWLNKHYYYNITDKTPNKRYYQQGKTQAQRIKILFQLIQQKCNNQNMLPAQIKQLIYRQDMRYTQILDILEEFAYMEKINLKRYINMQEYTNIYGNNQRNRPISNQNYSNQRSYMMMIQQNSSSIRDKLKDQQQPCAFQSSYNRLKRVYSTNIFQNIHSNNKVLIKRQYTLKNDKSNILLPRTQAASMISNRTCTVKYPKVHFSINNTPISTLIKPNVTSYDNRQIKTKSSQKQMGFKDGRSIIGEKQQKNIVNNVNNQLKIAKIDEHNNRQQTLQFIISTAFNSQTIIKGLFKPQFNNYYTPQQTHQQVISFAPTKQCIQIPQNLIQSQPKQQSLNKNTQNSQNFLKPQLLTLPYNIHNLSLSQSQNQQKSIVNFQIIPCKNIESSLASGNIRLSINQKNMFRQSLVEIKRIESMNFIDIQQYVRLKYLINGDSNSNISQTDQSSQQKSTQKIVETILQNRSSSEKSIINEIKNYKEAHRQQQLNKQMSSPFQKKKLQLKKSQIYSDNLDINFLQKILDQKYQIFHKTPQREIESDEYLHISKLEEGLKKFQNIKMRSNNQTAFHKNKSDSFQKDNNNSQVRISSNRIVEQVKSKRTSFKYNQVNILERKSSNIKEQNSLYEKDMRIKGNYREQSQGMTTLTPIKNVNNFRQEQASFKRLSKDISKHNRSNESIIHDKGYHEKQFVQNRLNRRKISYDELRQLLLE